jgi:hypothetical protein
MVGLTGVAARHCEGLPEAIQYFKKAAQSVGQSAISGLLRLRLAMTGRKKSCQSFNPINPDSDNFLPQRH